jgi:hypothetical protein
VFAGHYRRQEAAIVSRVPKGRKVDIGGVWYDEERWNRELSADLLRLNYTTALTWAEILLNDAGVEVDDMDVFAARMMPWLEEHSRIQATYINGYTRDELEAALRAPEPSAAVRDLFRLAATAWALREAIVAVTTASSFGTAEAANAGGLREKTWVVNSKNPRPSHAAQDGMTVGIHDLFPNGNLWPGDPHGSADENAGCQCSVIFS